MKRQIRVFICSLLVLALVFPVAAQDLTETYSPSDSSYTISYPAGWTLNETTGTSFALAEQSFDLTSGQQPRGVLLYGRTLSGSSLASYGDTVAAMLTGYAESDRRQEIEPAAIEATLPTVTGGADFFGIPEVFALVQIADDSYLYINGYTPGRGADDPLFINILKSVTTSNPLSAGDDAASDMAAGDVIRQWAKSATGTSQYASEDWSFDQATGAPNTAECGDNITAWASSGSDTSEVLALEFATPVLPVQVNIYQTYNPGAIVKIELSNTQDSTTIEIPDSADPPGNTACPGVFTLDVTEVSTPVNGVIIYFDQSITGSWNEIDAVELVGVSPDGAASDTSGAGLYNVVIVEFDANTKIDTFKVVRALTTLGLADAKSLVESAPNAIVLEGVTEDVATDAKAQLEATGAFVELVAVGGSGAMSSDKVAYTFETGGSVSYPADWVITNENESYVDLDALDGGVNIEIYGPIPLTPDEAAEFLKVEVEDILPASLADFISNTFPYIDTDWELMEYASLGEVNYVVRTFRTNSDAEVIILAIQFTNGQLAAIKVEVDTDFALDIPDEIKDVIPAIIESMQPGE